jgi:hypothetical protein
LFLRHQTMDKVQKHNSFNIWAQLMPKIFTLNAVSWEADIDSAVQEITILYGTKSSLSSRYSWIRSTPLTLYFFTIHFNIISYLHLYRKWSLPFRFPDYKYELIYRFCQACYMPLFDSWTIFLHSPLPRDEFLYPLSLEICVSFFQPLFHRCLRPNQLCLPSFRTDSSLS